MREPNICLNARDNCDTTDDCESLRGAWPALAAVLALAYAFAWGTLGRADELPQESVLSEKEKAERRMKFMMQALARYEAVYPGEPPQVAKLYEKPLLRWTNPVTVVKDGTLVVYTRGGAPRRGFRVSDPQ